MVTVEIRIAPAQVAVRLDELRRWLHERGCAYGFTSTGSSDEAVVLVDFDADADAAEFARQFSGSLVPG